MEAMIERLAALIPTHDEIVEIEARRVEEED